MNNLAMQIEKYDKQSWALVREIQKVSKLRIKLPKNLYDPIGRAKVSDKVLVAIDEKITEYFLK